MILCTFVEKYGQPTAWTACYTSVLLNSRSYDTWTCRGVELLRFYALLGKSMVNRPLGQPVIRLCCITRVVTIPGLVEGFSYHVSMHFWGKVWLTDSLDSLLYVCVA